MQIAEYVRGRECNPVIKLHYHLVNDIIIKYIFQNSNSNHKYTSTKLPFKDSNCFLMFLHATVKNSP